MWALVKNNVVGGEIMVKKYEKALISIITFSEKDVVVTSGSMEDNEVVANWMNEWDNWGN